MSGVSIIPGAEISASALSAERVRLDVVAQNLANMNTTRGADGQVYRRKVAVFEAMMDPKLNGARVQVSKIETDPRPSIQVYMPGHPHADDNGMVTMPNINMVEEMADMMTASRSYEANIQVLRTGKKMFDQSVEIGTTR